MRYMGWFTALYIKEPALNGIVKRWQADLYDVAGNDSTDYTCTVPLSETATADFERILLIR